MQCRRHIPGFAFSLVFVLSYFTNKFVLSVLKFTYPTLFQGWQTFIGAVLLLLSGKLGWVEMSFITRSSALSWLPASLLFVGNIYAGSRALSRLDIPFFFTLQNSSHVVTYVITTALHREKHKTHRLKTISIGLMLLSAVNLPLCDPQVAVMTRVLLLSVQTSFNRLHLPPGQVDPSAYLWAVCHLLCAGAYKAFEFHKSSNLSDCEQYCINCLFSVLVLALAAHPTGDLTGALEFPALYSGVFHCGCGASALLGFLLLLVTVKLKRGLSREHVGIWFFISKVSAMSLSPLVFSVNINTSSFVCVLMALVGEALLVFSDRDSTLG
uniref:Transmembrane protein 241 n=1 Tax=Oryzias sinensis TaxID=183150 RepID=A0A8C7ZPB2_9TELE